VTDERISRLRDLVVSALKLPEADREGFLARECANDENLLADAKALLAQSDSMAGFFRTGVGEDLLKNLPGAAGPDPADDQDVGGAGAGVGMTCGDIGGFTVRRLLGEGGMGVVYEAEQQNPRRLVALKVIRATARSDERHVKLFEREARALAQLDHPGIAAIHDAGRTEDGRHFFAMELVRGIPLHEYIERERDRTNTKEQLRLFTRICRAVDYAHKRGVIHRDLNPSNIFVLVPEEGEGKGEKQGGPWIKILDFGLARITESDVTLTTLTEEVGRIQGTLAYMSPEQARGDSKSIDHRSDVYSLGVVLYEMLTGTRPYDVRRTLVHQALKVICEDDPILPSALMPVLRGDLETILLKALEKSPGRRYQSVAEFAEDIERYLASKPILARPPSTTYQLRKLVARHKWPFAVAAGVFLLVVAFGVTMAVMYEDSRRAHARSEVEAAKAQSVNEFLQSMLASADPWVEGRDVTVRAVLDSAATKAYVDLAETPEIQGAVLQTLGNTYMGLGMYEESETHLMAALDIRTEALGGEHQDVGESLYALGMLQYNKGAFAEAESTLASALAHSLKSFDDDTPPVNRSRFALAGALQMQGKWQEAEAMFRRVLDVRRRLPGDNRRDVAESLSDLGWCLWMQARYAEAEPLYREALSIFIEIHGEEHPDVASVMDNLALLLDNQGKFLEAEPLHSRALDVRRRLLGENHRIVGVSIVNLGISIEMQGRYDEAESLYREALEVFREVHGNDHSFTGSTLFNIAFVLQLKGMYNEAEPYYREALEVFIKTVGERTPLASGTKKQLATILADMGRCEEAMSMLLDLKKFAEQKAPERRPNDIICRIGLCLAAEGRRAEADSLLRECREGVCAMANARYRIDMLRRCASVYESWDEPDMARLYLEELLKLEQGS
jgi:serine/threonine protein kinase/Flp pilus assembly protein TadD